MRKERGRGLLLFCAGFAVGAGIGVVLAPAPGAETRRRIADGAHHGRDFLDSTHEIYEMGRHLAEEAAGMVEDGRRLMRG